MQTVDASNSEKELSPQSKHADGPDIFLNFPRVHCVQFRSADPVKPALHTQSWTFLLALGDEECSVQK